MIEELDPEILQRMIKLVRDTTARDFTDYKESTLRRRICRRMEIVQAESCLAYLRLLENSPEEVVALCSALLVHVTEFFRDRGSFESLYETVFPQFEIQKEEIRVWCIACATGEEVYSTAILLEEYLRNKNLPYYYKIFATDIDQECLNIAAEGVYSAQDLNSIPERMRDAYFTYDGTSFQICQTIREKIVFVNHNVLKDIPFTGLNLIICRNLFIYIKPEMQRKLLSMFHRLLRKTGFLLLGSGESVQEREEIFLSVDKGSKIFRCSSSYHPSFLEDPIFPSLHFKSTISSAIPSKEKLREEMAWQILNAVLPPSVLIDSFGRILYTMNHLEKYIRIKQGRYDDTLLANLPTEMALAISTLIQKLELEGCDSASETVAGIAEYENQPIIVTGRRMNLTEGLYYLIQFRDRTQRFEETQESLSREALTEQHVHELQEALGASNLALKRAMNELEINKEELQSSFESLMASNEEYQSSNEELHSVNEELRIINEEYQKKISELTRMSEDLDNLLLNGEIGALYIDGDEKIRKITAIMSEISNLLPSDVRKPISQLHFMDAYPEFLQDVRTVFKLPQILERTVMAENGSTWLVKIRPYQSQNGKYDGILVTLFDITKRLEAIQLELQQLMDRIPGGIFEMKLDLERDLFHLLYASNGFYSILGYQKEDFAGKELRAFLLHCIYSEDQLRVREQFQKAWQTGSRSFQAEFRALSASRNVIWVTMESSLVEQNGEVILYGYFADCTQRRRKEEQIRISEERYRYALSLTKSSIWEYDFATKSIYQEDDSLSKYGMHGEVIADVPESMVENGIIHPDSAADFYALYYDVLAKGELRASWVGKARRGELTDEKASYAWTRITYMNILNDEGRPIRAIGIAEDLDEMYTANMRYDDEAQYREGIAAEALAAYSINVTQNKITQKQILKNNIDLVSLIGLEDCCNYDSFVKHWIETYVYPDDRAQFFDCRSVAGLQRAYDKGEREIRLEYRMIHVLPETSWIATTVLLIESKLGEDLCGFIYLKNIDAQKKEELELRRRAEIDSLTGLYNREAIETKINTYLATQAQNELQSALLLIDIDNFKGINDHFGHDYGDEVLRCLGRRIAGACGEEDCAGRLGGDEFVIFLPQIRSEEEALERMQAFCTLLACVFEGPLKKCQTSGSIGVVLLDKEEREFRSVYRKADKALYQAKSQGKNCACFYHELQKHQSSFDLELDHLTGICTRNSFEYKADALLQNQPNQKYAIVRMDINRFKFINDLYGMAEGDHVLQIIAGVLQELTCKNGVCARITGDIFCICSPYESDEDLILLIKEIMERVKKKCLKFRIDLYFGICKLYDFSTPISILCDWANMAIQTIKGSAMHKWAFYDEVLRVNQLNERSIEDEMEEALARGEFEVYLQPKHDIRTGRVVGAEALTRWRHPSKGLLMPGTYIGLFEQNGFVFHLDEYVYEQVCIFLHDWLKSGREAIVVSINLSRTYVFDPALPQRLNRVREEYQLPAQLLELEITESTFVENTAELYQRMNHIRQFGFRFSMDDFGAGYSNLNMLKDAPIDVVKLDRGFFNDAVTTKRGMAVIRHISSMAQDLELQVIAEGVETKEQADFLLNVGCTEAQGFLYSKALPIPQFIRFFDGQTGV